MAAAEAQNTFLGTQCLKHLDCSGGNCLKAGGGGGGGVAEKEEGGESTEASKTWFRPWKQLSQNNMGVRGTYSLHSEKSSLTLTPPNFNYEYPIVDQKPY